MVSAGNMDSNVRSYNRAMRLSGICLASVLLVAGCTSAQKPSQTVQTAGPQTTTQAKTDIPLTGNANRLDYTSLDPTTGRLYIAHLADSMLTVVDIAKKSVIADVHDLKNVHGVVAVPELHRVYATATGTNELAVIDDASFKLLERIPTGSYPDGVAYASAEKKLYVSDLRGHSDTVIDATTNKVVATITFEGPAGNTQYDAGSDKILVAVGGTNEVVRIDPKTDRIVDRIKLPGCEGAHGLLIDSERKRAFAACEDNAKLAEIDLAAMKFVDTHEVGDDPDVLALDPSLGLVYVAAECGIVTIFRITTDNKLELVSRQHLAARAHTLAVDPATHLAYLPLENVNGKPVLRIVPPPGT